MEDINTKRTEMANELAHAGAALLDFTGTACAIAAIPDTEPQQYVAAGTPEHIAALLPATIDPQRRQRHGDRPTEPLSFEDDAAPAVTVSPAPSVDDDTFALLDDLSKWDGQGGMAKANEFVGRAKAAAHLARQAQPTDRDAVAGLLEVAEELAESAEYWGEYDVPVGIADRLRAAIRALKGKSGEGAAS